MQFVAHSHVLHADILRFDSIFENIANFIITMNTNVQLHMAAWRLICILQIHITFYIEIEAINVMAS